MGFCAAGSWAAMTGRSPCALPHGACRRILRSRKKSGRNAMLTRRAMLGQAGAAAGAAWAMRAGVAVGGGRAHRGRFRHSPRGCDCHVHVFGDPAKFPFAEKRIYTPPQASIEQLLELQRDLRLERVVVVQPSVYGSRQCLHGRRRAPHGRARARRRGHRQDHPAQGAGGDGGGRHPRRAAEPRDQHRGTVRPGRRPRHCSKLPPSRSAASAGMCRSTPAPR